MNTPKILPVILVLLLSISGTGFALDKVGTSGFVFMELPATARQVGLGEAYSSIVPQDASAIFHNPKTIISKGYPCITRGSMGKFKY